MRKKLTLLIGGGNGERLGSHCLSFRVPSFNSHTVILTHLGKLGKSCKHLLTESEEQDFDKDIKVFVNDKSLPSFKKSNRIDICWTGETMNKKYPTLCKVAKALDTIFHGAQAESYSCVADMVSLTLSDENQQKCI